MRSENEILRSLRELRWDGDIKEFLDQNIQVFTYPIAMDQLRRALAEHGIRELNFEFEVKLEGDPKAHTKLIRCTVTLHQVDGAFRLSRWKQGQALSGVLVELRSFGAPQHLWTRPGGGVLSVAHNATWWTARLRIRPDDCGGQPKDEPDKSG